MFTESFEDSTFGYDTLVPETPIKLPPLNLYSYLHQPVMAEEGDPLCPMIDDNVFLDNNYSGGVNTNDLVPCPLMKEENWMTGLVHGSPLHDDYSSGFYSHSFGGGASSYGGSGGDWIIDSPSCSVSTCDTDSLTQSPFINSPSSSQYHQTFQFPPVHTADTDDWPAHLTSSVTTDEDEETVEILHCRWVDCKGSYQTQEELVQHIERSHVDQRRAEDFTCFWAGCPRRHRPFNARYKLLIHMRVHSGEKPNRCSVS